MNKVSHYIQIFHPVFLGRKYMHLLTTCVLMQFLLSPSLLLKGIMLTRSPVADYKQGEKIVCLLF